MKSQRQVAIYTGGIVILFIILGIISLSQVKSWQKRTSGFKINLKFSNLNNLAIGADVLLAGGIRIGEVDEIYQKDLQTYVRLFLNKEMENRIPKNDQTQFSIFSTTLTGQKYVNLFLPEPKLGDSYLQDGEEWWGVSPPSIDEMLLTLSSWFDGKSGGDIVSSIGDKAGAFIKGINKISKENHKDAVVIAKMATKSFKQVGKQIDLLSNNFKIMVSGNSNVASKGHIKDIQDQMKRASLQLASLTKKIKSKKGSLVKLMTNKKFHKNMQSTLFGAKKLFKCLSDNPEVLIRKSSNNPCN